MAQDFDAGKATTDLKQLLNLSLVNRRTDKNPEQGDDSADRHSSVIGSNSNEIDTEGLKKDPQTEKSVLHSQEQTTVNDCGLVLKNCNQNAFLPEEKASVFKSSPKQKTKSNPVPLNGDKATKKKSKAERLKVKESPTSADKSSQEQKKKKGKELSLNSSDKNFNSKSSTSQGKSLSSNQNLSMEKRTHSPAPRSSNNQEHNKMIQKSNNNENNGESTAKNPWDNLSREMQIKLDENKIYFIKKKKIRFPNAKYFCRLCDYHMDNVDICEKHIQDARHAHKKEVNNMDSVLQDIPPPSSNHHQAITNAMERLYEEHGLKVEDRELRKTIVDRLEKQMQDKIADARLHMYGTSLTRMGLKTADINVNLYSKEKDKKLTTLLKETYNLMKDRTDTGFINVHSDFSATVPALILTDAETGLKLTVTIHFYSSLCTSELLCIYSDFDDRVSKLAVAFRYWAQLCGVDRHQVGFIPPVALNIMVIFFLQTVKPQVLPIVVPPGICGEDSGDFSKDKPVFQLKRNKAMKTKAELHNEMSIGELWLLLIKFYSIELDIPNTVISIRSSSSVSRSMKPWNSKKLAVEDPFMLKKNLTRMVSHSYEFWLYTIKKVYHYFALPRGQDGKSYLPNFDFPGEDEDSQELPSKNKMAENNDADNNQVKDAPSEFENVQTTITKNSENMSNEEKSSHSENKESGSQKESKNTSDEEKPCPSENTESGGKKESENASDDEKPCPSENTESGGKKESENTSDEEMPCPTENTESGGKKESENTSDEEKPCPTENTESGGKKESENTSDEEKPCPTENTESGGKKESENTSDEEKPCPSENTESGGKKESENTSDEEKPCPTENTSDEEKPCPTENTESGGKKESENTSDEEKPCPSENTSDEEKPCPTENTESKSQKESENMSDEEKQNPSVDSVEDNLDQQLETDDHSVKESKESSDTDSSAISQDASMLESTVLQSMVLEYVNSIVERALDLVTQKSTSPLSDKAVTKPCSDSNRPESGSNMPFKDGLVNSIKSSDILHSGAVEEKDDADLQQRESSSQDSKDSGAENHSSESHFYDKDCVYSFSKKNFMSKKEPTLVCTSCEKEGHHKNECPDDKLPEILPISGFTDTHHKALEEALKRMPSAVGLSQTSIQQRQMVLDCLEDFIQVGFHGARLQLFGSSCNGFGFDRSDMDICMTFAKKKPYFDKVLCVERLANILKQHRDLKNVQAISTAKVPIVKFTIRGSELDADISLYNTLAQENTRLLQCYSRIDPRVQVLGYTIKTFAQVCDIGDASRGSLSSYAYILMMLYYLQQVSPPVIPVLQELHQSKEKPKNVVEGWDAWFMDDLQKLKDLWPDMGKNKQSAAELWLGFLRFYVEEFDYREYVISIRQKEPLTRFDKLWNGFCLAVEDPFELSHNLGSGLSQMMNTFILKTFINGRMLYGSPIDDNMELYKKYQSSSDYFFDAELLSEARPPNSRGCRHCGKIGHLMRHCPVYKKERDEQQQHKQQQQNPNNPSRPPHDQQRPPPNQQQRYAQGQQRHQDQQRYQQEQHKRFPGHQRQQQQQNQRSEQMQAHEKGPKLLEQQQQPLPDSRTDPVQPLFKHQQQRQPNHPQQPPPLQQQQQQQFEKHKQPQKQQNKPPRFQQQQQQQQHSNKPMSFQQQKQIEAQQLQKQLEREWFGESNRDNKLPHDHRPSGSMPNYSTGLSMPSPLPSSSYISNVPLVSHCGVPATLLQPSPLTLNEPQSASASFAPTQMGAPSGMASEQTLPLFFSAPPGFSLANSPALVPTTPHNLNHRPPLLDLNRMSAPQRFPPSLMPTSLRPRGPLHNAQAPFRGPSPRGAFPQQPYTYHNNRSGNNTNNSNSQQHAYGYSSGHMPSSTYSRDRPHPGSRAPPFPSSGHTPSSPHIHGMPTPQQSNQGMSPNVQSLFASAQGKVLDARTMQPHSMKNK